MFTKVALLVSVLVGCQHAPPAAHKEAASVPAKLTSVAAATAKADPPKPPSPPKPVTPTHPLDSLTASELRTVVELVTAKTGTTTLFPIIEMLEPPKADVLAWTKGRPFERRARAVARFGAKNYEATIDLDTRTITDWSKAEGEPMILFQEFMGATALALQHPKMTEGLAKRGIKPEQVHCLPLTAGNFFDGKTKNRRLLKVPCFMLPGPGSNWFSRPVEGLFATVDLNSMTVLSVTDSGIVPVSNDVAGYREDEVSSKYMLRERTSPPKLTASGPDSINVDGATIEWDIWRFHLRTEKRPGLVVSQVQVRDEARWRSVLYQAHMSEVFVPYMDPDEAIYWRTYMDSGEYGFGVFLSPLTRGSDCPVYARFMPARVHLDTGDPLEIPDAICVFERQIGDAAWRHFEAFAQGAGPVPAESRPWTELVVRSASTVGNYDYFVDYVFQQDGKIRVMVGSTGIDAVRGVASTSMKDASAKADTRYGTLVAPNIVAPNHDHFFNFRLDFDIDGQKNNFVRMGLVPGRPKRTAKRRSFWVTKMSMPKTEDKASYRVSYDRPAMYHVANRNIESGLGHHPTYMIAPLNGFAYSPLDVRRDPPMIRNSYIDKTFWVTPYDASQKYAGGKFAFQSTGKDTLPIWTKAKRSVDNQDIVVWVTLGFHHVPHMEDWPVMATMWKGMMLAPFNFFDHNPAITIRASETQ